MRAPRRVLIAASALLTAAGLVVTGNGVATAAPSSTALSVRNVPVCPTPQNADAARCDAIRHDRVDSQGKPVNPFANGLPAGYGPTDLQAAYSLAQASTSVGGGRTIAIVDAYDHPYAASDLNVYRSTFSLPDILACDAGTVSRTDGAPCFVKVNQNGTAGSYPRADGGWAQEISLDLDMASAICPRCNILLVEASSSSFTNLGTAVNTAAHLGAVAISNSYGSTGDASDNTYSQYYSHPGIAVTASTGDNGYGVSYPASSAYTVAVGGTTLERSSASRGWSETVWSGAGSGCSTYNTQPEWQATVVPTTACGNRASADVSAVANPNTGVAVYDSYSYQGAAGWMVFGGTSVSSPIIASVYALAGRTGPGTGVIAPSLPYGTSGALYDVTSGSNGSCGGTVLCSAGSGWDGPTGLGTPNGLAAFGGSSGGSGSGSGGTTAPVTLSGSCSNASCTFTASGTSPYVWTIDGARSAETAATITQQFVAGTHSVTVDDALPSEATLVVSCLNQTTGHGKRTTTTLVCSVA